MSSPDPGAALARLDAVVRALRAPDGCPWDRRQTLRSMAPYLIEEAYEAVEAIEADDAPALTDELGDVLFNLVFLGQLLAEQGAGDLAAAAERARAKMVRRHPHVFGDAEHDEAAWQADKAAARAAEGDADPSALAGVSTSLPPLTRAATLQRRAARVGFDWAELPPVIAKITEELAELEAELAAEPRDGDRLRAETGDLLFSVVNLARHLELDPGQALREANRAFEARFRRVEALAGDPRDHDLETLERFWQQAKQEQAEAPPG